MGGAAARTTARGRAPAGAASWAGRARTARYRPRSGSGSWRQGAVAACCRPCARQTATTPATRAWGAQGQGSRALGGGGTGSAPTPRAQAGAVLPTFSVATWRHCCRRLSRSWVTVVRRQLRLHRQQLSTSSSGRSPSHMAGSRSHVGRAATSTSTRPTATCSRRGAATCRRSGHQLGAPTTTRGHGAPRRHTATHHLTPT
mmetsp:Transcript_9592/g.23765  ORF Transcript_9592/g.23765 Transcript_9592/m.23765 type:complete len:201 (+) Transcript_9592:4383-4985(+)